MAHRLLLPLLLMLAVAACAAQPTAYVPRDGGRYGYDQRQIDANTWRVEFAGNIDTPRRTVEDYLLYRSAEIMRFGGFDRFIVLEKEVERTVDYRGGSPYPHHVGLGVHGHRGRHSRHGVGFGYYYGPSHYDALTSYAAFATIRTYAGGPPPAGLQVYDAGEVIRQLGPTVAVPR